MARVTVLLPTLNEARALPAVAEQMPLDVLRAAGHDVRVLVVDGRSTDGTQSIALGHGYAVLEQTGPKGKGFGIRQAFLHFLESSDDLLVMLDADGTYDPRDIPRIVKMLDAEYDVVIGTRLRGRIDNGAMSRLNYVGNHLLTWLAVVLYRKNLSDLCTGYWGFQRQVVEEMRLNSVNFEIEAEMYTACAHNGFRFGEIPIHYANRIGEPKLGSIHDGARILRKLLVRRFIRQPIHDVRVEAGRLQTPAPAVATTNV